jgi:hypothetical protein
MNVDYINYMLFKVENYISGCKIWNASFLYFFTFSLVELLPFPQFILLPYLLVVTCLDLGSGLQYSRYLYPIVGGRGSESRYPCVDILGPFSYIKCGSGYINHCPPTPPPPQSLFMYIKPIYTIFEAHSCIAK